MYKHNDLQGQRFGRLYVVGDVGRTKDRHILWYCLCDCGNEVSVSSRDLVSGHTRSCGCYKRDRMSEVKYIHGDRDARLYSVWKTMKRRCENPNCKTYKWYGAKGVRVCDEWHDYTKFREWANLSGYDETAKYGDCTIDRINPYGNYEPNNCRWVNIATQNRNKRAKADMIGGAAIQKPNCVTCDHFGKCEGCEKGEEE